MTICILFVGENIHFAAALFDIRQFLSIRTNFLSLDTDGTSIGVLIAGITMQELEEKMKKEEQGHPAIFLDRDGVLCKEKGYVTSLQELEIFPYAKLCVESIHRKGFLAICITNQSAVARGMMTEKELLELNKFMKKELGLGAVYYCPHHPQGVGKYGVACTCRNLQMFFECFPGVWNNISKSGKN